VRVGVGLGVGVGVCVCIYIYIYINILLRRRDGAESLRDNERVERRRSVLYTIHSCSVIYILQRQPYGTIVINTPLSVLCVCVSRSIVKGDHQK